MRWFLLFVVLPALTACDEAFDLTPVEAGCGDGALATAEGCDDGATEPGDGCDATCQIEPAFECHAPNEPCLPVVGLSRGIVTTTLDKVGDNSGSPFSFTCPDGEVVIGVEGYVNSVGDNLGGVRVVCGALGIVPSGDAQLTRATESPYFDGEQYGSLLTVQCAPDEMVTGIVPTTNTYISGFQWICQKVSHAGGALVFGASRMLSFGPMAGTVESMHTCGAREVVTSAYGTAGGSLDSLGLACGLLSTVVCGDGVETAPEMCDDGNVERGDGCGRRCELE